MPTTIGIKWNKAEFDRTFKECAKFSKRVPSVFCNTTASYIARGAYRLTQKATKKQIRSDLMAEGRIPAPIAALIVNSERAKQGLPGLYGSKMRTAVNELIDKRQRGTLAAGWIPAIKKLAPLAEKIGSTASVGNAPKAKGGANAAKDGFWTCQAKIWNQNQAPWDTKGTANAVAEEGLAKAFDQETASKKQYLERKLREAARKAGVKTN